MRKLFKAIRAYFKKEKKEVNEFLTQIETGSFNLPNKQKAKALHEKYPEHDSKYSYLYI